MRDGVRVREPVGGDETRAWRTSPVDVAYVADTVRFGRRGVDGVHDDHRCSRRSLVKLDGEPLVLVTTHQDFDHHDPNLVRVERIDVATLLAAPTAAAGDP